MAKTEAQPIASKTESSGSRTIFMLAGAALALAAIAIATLFFTQQESGSRVAVWYTTLSGTEIKEGDANGPLRVIARVPDADQSKGYILTLGLQLVDESGQPAKYGPSQESTLPMRPSTQQDLWEYTGSLPTTPGAYHARLQVQRSSNQAEPESIDVPLARIGIKPDTGPQLNSGFVFNRDGNLWIASTDATRQRRLTFFPPP